MAQEEREHVDAPSALGTLLSANQRARRVLRAGSGGIVRRRAQRRREMGCREKGAQCDQRTGRLGVKGRKQPLGKSVGKAQEEERQWTDRRIQYRGQTE